jgi:hypothetical protein
MKAEEENNEGCTDERGFACFSHLSSNSSTVKSYLMNRLHQIEVFMKFHQDGVLHLSLAVYSCDKIIFFTFVVKETDSAEITVITKCY